MNGQTFLMSKATWEEWSIYLAYNRNFLLSFEISLVQTFKAHQVGGAELVFHSSMDWVPFKTILIKKG